jgi:hypothetical protein
MDLEQFDDFMADSNARARRGRLLARQMFGLAVLLAAFMYVAAPNLTNSTPNAGAFTVAAPALGIAGLMIGFVWMVRILRADPEPEAKGWRYRDF